MLKIESNMILTNDLNKCPSLTCLRYISAKTLRNLDGNPEVEAIICTRDIARLCENFEFPELKLIQLFSAGYENINLSHFKSKGIAVCNAANVYNIGMAEFVVFSLLMHAKRYHKSIKRHGIRFLRNYHYISELAGKTVGILGAGDIGLQVAKRLGAFDMRIIGYATHASPRLHIEKIFTPSDGNDFITSCDYIVNCMPLTQSTHGIINNDWFSKMKANVCIINVGRKQIFNRMEFLSFLKSHKDATAILDMFERFPNPITNPFRRLPNVLILPGVTAISSEINIKLKNLIKENINNLHLNKPFINRI